MQDVTVTLRSVVEADDDGLGNTTRTAADVDWGPCSIAPRYARESTDPGQPALIVGRTVYGPPPPVPLDSGDQLVIAGEVWQVDGLPGDWGVGFEVPIKRAGT